MGVISMCEWCDYKESEWLLYKSLYWSVYLADVQDYVGRCILVSNRHCGSLSELDIAEWIELKTIIDRLEYIYKDILGAELSNFIFSVKISLPLENTGVSSVFAASVWPFSLIFSLARRNEGNFFQAVPTTLSSSLAEVRLASLVAWA